MDSALIPKGVKRCPFPQFMVALTIVGAVLLWGVFAMLLVWIKGLNQTNMNNAYGSLRHAILILVKSSSSLAAQPAGFYVLAQQRAGTVL